MCCGYLLYKRLPLFVTVTRVFLLLGLSSATVSARRARVRLGALSFGILIDPRSCPFLTLVKLVTMSKYKCEKHTLVCI